MVYLSFLFLFIRAQALTFADNTPVGPVSDRTTVSQTDPHQSGTSTTNNSILGKTSNSTLIDLDAAYIDSFEDSPIFSLLGDKIGSEVPSEDYSSYDRGDPEINLEWFYANTAVPQILKDILQDGAAQEEVQRHAYDLHIGCRTFLDSGLEDFINHTISPLFNEKPGFCSIFGDKEQIEVVETRMQLSQINQNSEGESKPGFIEREVTVNYNQWSVNSEALELNHFNNAFDQFVADQISKRIGTQDTVRIQEPSDDLPAKDMYQMSTSSSRPPRELVGAGLLRLWSTLSRLEQMQLLRNCPERLSLNNLRGFWNTSSADQRGNKANYELGLKLCKAENLAEVTPLLDKSLLSEYMLNLMATDSFDSIKIIQLCDAWPATNLATSSMFPKAANSDELFFNIGEHHRESIGFSSYALSLFNPLELEGLTQAQREAIEAYTSSNYNAMNAYQMWGNLGLFFLNRNNEEDSRPLSEEDLADLSPEQRREYLNSRDVYQTIHGERTSTAVNTLRNTLRDMDQFEGVTFSAQKLSGHLFTSLRVGSTFNPDFFMSSSIDQNVAQGFLDFDLGPDNEEERYLFVIENRTGVPITNHSRFPEEQEVLIHPDASFTVLAVEPYVHNGEIIDNVKVVYIAEKP